MLGDPKLNALEYPLLQAALRRKQDGEDLLGLSPSRFSPSLLLVRDDFNQAFQRTFVNNGDICKWLTPKRPPILQDISVSQAAADTQGSQCSIAASWLHPYQMVQEVRENIKKDSDWMWGRVASHLPCVLPESSPRGRKLPGRKKPRQSFTLPNIFTLPMTLSVESQIKAISRSSQTTPIQAGSIQNSPRHGDSISSTLPTPVIDILAINEQTSLCGKLSVWMWYGAYQTTPWPSGIKLPSGPS